MSRLTKLDLWLLDKLSAWWDRRRRKGRHRTDGMSTMASIRAFQVSR